MRALSFAVVLLRKNTTTAPDAVDEAETPQPRRIRTALALLKCKLFTEQAPTERRRQQRGHQR